MLYWDSNAMGFKLIILDLDAFLIQMLFLFAYLLGYQDCISSNLYILKHNLLFSPLYLQLFSGHWTKCSSKYTTNQSRTNPTTYHFQSNQPRY